jgi:kexin
MPTEEDDNDHDQVSTTTTLPASTTTLTPDPATAEESLPSVTSSNHPDRPVNAKPTDTTSTPSSTTPTSSPTISSAPESTTTKGSTWLPSFLPTLGVSGRTQAWIYGALGLIVVFCSGLGAYFWMARRKRLRNSPRDDYEFEPLDEEEAEGLNSGEKNRGAAGVGKKGRRTRGAELYDAFAGGSEDDDDDGDFGADEYRDRRDEMSGGRGSQMSERESGDFAYHQDEQDGDAEHHVVGGDSDDEESGDDRPLRGGR